MQTQTAKKRAFDKEKSRVKLVVYANDNSYKPWYSFMRDDRKGYEHTINVMKKRILADIYHNKFKRAIFYNTHNDSKMLEIDPNDIARTVVKSKVKLIAYDKNNQKYTFFSNEHEDKQPIEHIIGSMNMRLLQYKLCGKYNCAMFYDVQSDEEIARYSPYGRVQK